MTLQTKLSELKGVGKQLEERLAAMGLNTVSNLIEYYPRRYDDYSNITSISQIKPGLVSVKVCFRDISERRVRRGLHITHAVAQDRTGRVAVVWFNQPYRAKSITSSKTYFLSGEFGLQKQRLQIVNPNIESAEFGETTQTARILATYRESGSVTSVFVRKLISQIISLIDNLPETLPEWMVNEYDLMSFSSAVKTMHQPPNQYALDNAKQRLGFDELFVVMTAAQTIRNQTIQTRAIPIKFNQKIAVDFVKHLPFKLTEAQRKTAWQIFKDLAHEEPMDRLIEGDVGSGKTVVAAMASLMVADAGLQVAFVAPTELLANQHAETITKLLAHTSLTGRVALLTGSLKQPHKRTIKERLTQNELSIVVGTHALFQETVDWHRLGLIIIDEQHRFGVQQRQKLYLKAGHMPHVLCLTATPIPRSLALTVYGELDISILDQAPSTRAGVDTSIVSPNSTTQMFTNVEAEIKAGRQAYVVCPLIAESEMLQVANAEQLYKQLSQREFKKWRVGILHGRLKATEKEAIMSDFKAHKLDVIVSTTVIEVGVDVANATVMIIYGADRFGLAQLHQLRGRVGRAEHRGHCYLIMSDSGAPSKRMRAIESTTDGFKLAELDLEIRGPGAIYGTRQHGELDLRIAQLSDSKLIAKAKHAVRAFSERGENLIKYKQIAAKVERSTKLTYLN